MAVVAVVVVVLVAVVVVVVVGCLFVCGLLFVCFFVLFCCICFVCFVLFVCFLVGWFVVCCLLCPPTGCSRADTLLNVHFLLFFYSVFCFSTMLPWGGQEQLFLRVMFSAFVHLHWFLQCFSRFRTLVFLHHLRFPLVLQCFQAS